MKLDIKPYLIAVDLTVNWKHFSKKLHNDIACSYYLLPVKNMLTFHTCSRNVSAFYVLWWQLKRFLWKISFIQWSVKNAFWQCLVACSGSFTKMKQNMVPQRLAKAESVSSDRSEDKQLLDWLSLWPHPGLAHKLFQTF